MWSYEFVISLVFRWIDLFMVLGLMAYGFWRWGMPYFKQEMADEQKSWQELQDRLDRSVQDVRILDETLRSDRQSIERLEQQVMLWRSVCEEKQHELVRKWDDIIVQLAQKNEEKIAGMFKHAVYKKVLPEALDQVEHELKKRYDGQGQQSLFIETIIENLQKGNV